MKKVVQLMMVLVYLCAVNALAHDASCPWRISSIEVGKWANGNIKSRIWVNGSFPIPPGVSERPTWYVNGVNVGYSQIFFSQRTLPNSSHLLKPGKNTIRVQFLRPPYNGASNEKIILDFSWGKVPNGGHKRFQ